MRYTCCSIFTSTINVLRPTSKTMNDSLKDMQSFTALDVCLLFFDIMLVLPHESGSRGLWVEGTAGGGNSLVAGGNSLVAGFTVEII